MQTARDLLSAPRAARGALCLGSFRRCASRRASSTAAGRLAVVCAAPPAGVPQASRQPRRLPAQRRSSLIQLVAANVEAVVSRFENIAGRSAMIGFIVALSIELIGTPQGLFGGLDRASATVAGSVGLVLIAIAAALGAASTRKLGLRLKEAVLTSLTAVQGSRASPFAPNVDDALQFVIDNVFDKTLVDGHLVADRESAQRSQD